MNYMKKDEGISLSEMCSELKGEKHSEWVNLGGQLMKSDDLDLLRSDIGSGRLNNWKEVHNRYDELWVKYSLDKQKHAFATLCELTGKNELTKADWIMALDKAASLQDYVCEKVFDSRKKDFDNPFRRTTFRNAEEMTAALGTLDNNSFIVQVRKETEDFKKVVEELKLRS